METMTNLLMVTAYIGTIGILSAAVGAILRPDDPEPVKMALTGALAALATALIFSH